MLQQCCVVGNCAYLLIIYLNTCMVYKIFKTCLTTILLFIYLYSIIFNIIKTMSALKCIE